jgi:hypothetical protein
MRRPRPLISLSIALCAIAFAVQRRAQASYSFYIDQNTSYSTNHGCGTNNDLDDDTASLASQLTTDGWTGSHFVDANAWPADFTEACSSTYGTGDDSYYADSAYLSIFSGHANAGYLAFAYPHNSVCSVDLGANARLGSMAGDTSGVAIFYGCCTLKLSSLTSKANWQWTNQNLGFLDTESDGDDDIKNFFNGTSSSANIYQWTADLEDRPGWFTGDNSPIVVSYGADETSAGYVEDYGDLYYQVYLYTRSGGPSCGQGQPGFWYNYYYIDNNNGGC